MSTDGMRRILLATDFSPCAEAALRRAIALAQPFGATITLLNVYQPHFYPSPPFGLVVDEADLKRQAERSGRELAATMDRFAGSGAKLELRSTAGVIPDAILDAAKDGFDLLIMGTHGAGGVKEFFLGSVAERVVRRATIPVLTVRG
jgi:nucleotide-binding universal stress UspA family protein